MKTYIITGASSGIGAALAMRLKLEPANDVINISRRENPITHNILVDLATENGVVEAQFELKRRIPSTLEPREERYFVGCAGAFDFKAEDPMAMIILNLYQHYRLATLAVTRLKCQGIVLVSSVSGIHGEVDDPVYAACKAGLIALTGTLAAKYPGVKVNCVAPGFVRTPMEDGTPEAAIDAWVAKIPERRRAAPSEIADLILYLLTAPYVNGHTVVADGGLMYGNWRWD
jgi:3-oxoacyl-[acyl-carrier protein] reductase